MFSEQVIGFGTRHDHLDGLAELERTQWRDVWEETSGFEVRVLRVLGEDPVVVVGLWSSTSGRGGSGAIRRGRITIVLEPGPTDLVALHTHVSLAPEGDAIR